MSTRRKFIKKIAGAAGSAMIVPGAINAMTSKVSGSVRGQNALLKYGVIGCGERGQEIIKK
jgi:hypothetical protein